MKTIISLVSEQTLPNVLFAKEIHCDRHIFIYTNSMKKKFDTLKKVLNLDTILENEKEVDAENLQDIEQKLSEIHFSENEHIIVNFTGGNKIMAIGVYNFFVNKQCKIWYIPIGKNEIMELFPAVAQLPQSISYRISLKDYLLAYDVKIDERNFNSKNITFDFSTTNAIFQKNKNRNQWVFNKNWSEIKSKDAEVELERVGFLYLSQQKYEQVKENLQEINFVPQTQNKLLSNEVKYLISGWWEEYLYHKIKEKFALSDDYIGINIEVNKENSKPFPASNEFDILFVYENVLYVLECKTGIKDLQASGMKLFNEYVYKLSALRKFSGLAVKLNLCILQKLPSERTKNDFFKDRAEIMQIQLFDGNNFDHSNFENFLEKLVKK